MKRTPLKRGSGNRVPAKVREQVRTRSKGLCEIKGTGEHWNPDRAWFRAMDLHHLVKRPRLHKAWAIVHLCRRHHELCEVAYAKGRLVIKIMYRRAPDGVWERSDYLWWRIEVRERKGAPLLSVLAEGRIAL